MKNDRGSFGHLMRQAVTSGGTPTNAAAASNGAEEIDDHTRSLIGSYERALSTGSVAPMVKTFGMGKIANLLRGVPLAGRNSVAKQLFSPHPDDVRSALRTIAHAHRGDDHARG